MLIELYIFFEIIAIGLFVSSFFTKQEILWAITIVLFGVLMYTSFNVEYYVYNWNLTVQAYQPEIISHSYPYLMGLNMLFFILGMILGIFDLFDKYGSRFVSGNNK